MAIITRWLMPPESWCGYTSSREAGSGMPTGQQVDSALAASAAVAALMHLQRLHDLVTDGIARVQAGHRIPEDHRYFRTHQLAALFSEILRRSRR